MASDCLSHMVTTHLDAETGELRQEVICLKSARMTYCEMREASRGAETSERTTFRVPKVAQTTQTAREYDDWPIYNQKELRINSMQTTVLSKTQNISPIVYLLPTLLFFPAWASMMCAVCEASIHIWAHKRNRGKGKDDTIYRSPLNLISSEFCAKCRTEKWMDKISKIQDKRSLRRNLIDPAFIKQAVR